MKRTGLALLMTAALAVWMSLSPAHAVPPTATPSPGYDARLQEQRAAQRRHVEPTLNPPKAPRQEGARIDAMSPEAVTSPANATYRVIIDERAEVCQLH